jgi:predicted metal-dependent hydrolase
VTTGTVPNFRPVGAIAYTVRRSERARCARLVVSSEGVELVVPRRMSLSDATPLVRDKRSWLERQLRRLAAAEAVHPPPQIRDGGPLPYMGRQLRLRIVTQPGRRRTRVRRQGDTLVVAVGSTGNAIVRSALERWYRERARVEIGHRLDEATARAGTSYGRLTIRDQRTRWASCSPNGTMSFNWRLLLAPEPILAYVVEHEVVHLEVPDHSPRFWRVLARRLPGYREREHWLRRHGPSLRLT